MSSKSRREGDSIISDVDSYIASFDTDTVEKLRLIRTLIAEIAPEAVESLAYGLVGYKLGGKPLVYFGAYKNHIGLYATPNAHREFTEEFALYKQGKGSVQFPNNQPLPLDLIRRVVVFRKEAVYLS